MYISVNKSKLRVTYPKNGYYFIFKKNMIFQETKTKMLYF